ncbi:hypothetical protein HFN_1104 [Helicobacter fennelliae MRY12-0050]|uniref:Uncharacterized protein n=1 Tax=Helicobacter fennelliae MRY12-0050 TaxID=1325130 RepID=T1CSQ8_9HELI|nr:hypothetical protein HFN_1104 [Helicobacter fennelliae MRY12-0050]
MSYEICFCFVDRQLALSPYSKLHNLSNPCKLILKSRISLRSLVFA